MDNVITVIKFVGGLVASIGIGAVAKNVIIATTPAGTKIAVKICINVGGYFIAGLAGAAAGKQFEKKVDAMNNVVKKLTLKRKKKSEIV